MKEKENLKKNKTILLIMLPYWDQQIPPLGIACLKSYIERNSLFKVKNIDANTNIDFYNYKKRYFFNIEKVIPEDKRLHLYNIGMDVLSEHMMAFAFSKTQEELNKIIYTIFYNTFYYDISANDVELFNEIIGEFFNKLLEYVLALVKKYNPSKVGLSVNKGSFAASMFVCNIIKERFPYIETIFGGPIFSSDLKVDTPNYNRFIKVSKNIDKIIVGEGEQLLLNLIQGKLKSNQKVYTKDDLINIVDAINEYKPDFSDFDLNYYLYQANFASRSCPFQCSFCSETVFWGDYRKRNIKNVVTELKTLYNKNKKQLFYMCDSLLNPLIDDLTKELSENKLAVYFDGYLRIDKKSGRIENTLFWRKGGFYRARLGIESGSEKILDLMNKKISPLEIKSAVINLAKAGIKTTTMWVVGHPEETEEDFLATLNLIEELQDYIYEADCNPFIYYFSGQVDSNKWEKYRETLYPEEYNNSLIIQKWKLNYYPSREEAYSRVNRFIKFCKSLGVPNSYSLKETYLADIRWKNLHENAVPGLVDFDENNIAIDERYLVKETIEAEVTNIDLDINNWNF